MTSEPSYLKRYRMELDLRHGWPTVSDRSECDWRAWHLSLLESHAEAKFLSFRDELDTQIFPNLSHIDGCLELMRAIRDCPGFCPQATWLSVGLDGVAGTVQGVIDLHGIGAIQNIGVVPIYRGFGIGAGLLARALTGFRECGCKWVSLEVSAKNEPAVRLYRSFGFRCTRTVYKAVVVEPASVGMGI